MNCLQEIREMNENIVGWRRDLHRFPELDNDLPQTKAYVTARLKEMGADYTEYGDQSGLCVVLGKPGGKVAAIRGDMDGLPVNEATGLAFASSNGCMHACGHDAHMAILLAVVRFFKEHESELDGQIKVIFQPGEENLFGAAAMIKDGVLANPSVDRLFALHVGIIGGNDGVGGVIVPKRNVFLASEIVDIIINGKSGHAARPHNTIDSVAIAAEIIMALQTIVSRELQPGVLGLISCSAIHSSSTVYNVISENCRIYANMRAKDPEVQDFLLRRSEELARGIAEAHGATLTFRRVAGAPPAVNDPDVVADFLKSAEKVVEPGVIHISDEVNLGAEDCAYFMEKVPSCYFFLSTPKAAMDGNFYPHHSEKFDIDETTLYRGAALLAQASLDFINGADDQ